MTDQSLRRLVLARELIPLYAARPEIRFILLGGSVAQGNADDYSDIDLVLYWNHIDTDWLSEPPLVGEGIERFTSRVTLADSIYLEQYQVGDVKVDFGHVGLRWWEQIVGDVVDRGEIEAYKLETIGGFLGAELLHDKGEYAYWRQRVERYPDAVAVAAVRSHIAFYPRWVYEGHGLNRGDLLNFYTMLLHGVNNIIGILGGLNRVYLSSEKGKRTPELLAKMSIAPNDVVARIDAILSGNRDEAPRLLNDLVSEVLDLVDHNMPDVDTTRSRKILALG